MFEKCPMNGLTRCYKKPNGERQILYMTILSMRVYAINI